MVHILRFLNCKKMSNSKRFFLNNLPPDVSMDQTVQKQRTEGLVSTVMNNFTPSSQTVDGGLYVGVGGVSYMLLHLSKTSQFEEFKAKYLDMAQKNLELPLQEAVQVMHSGHITDKTGFMTGNVGVYAVAAVVYAKLGKKRESDQCLVYFRQVEALLKPINWFRNGGDELFVGRAGFLCALSWLRKELGVEIIPEPDVFSMLDTMIESGKNFANSVQSPIPLMYHYYGTQYLGPAHGLAGILFVMLGYPLWLQSRPEAANLIKTSIDLLLQFQTIDGNFPCAMDEIGGGRRLSEDELVHWCHGAPGTVYLLARAFKIFREDKYLTAALKCGEISWKKGLLKKGAGICHGIAGNGYVFLVLYQLTNDPEQLKRAYQFMNFIYNPEFTKAKTPDSPYSLFEGLAGTACFAGDLLQPESASFPFFQI